MIKHRYYYVTYNFLGMGPIAHKMTEIQYLNMKFDGAIEIIKAEEMGEEINE